MSPLPYNNTAVMTFFYAWSRGAGQVQVRCDNDESGRTAARQWLNGLLAALAPALDEEWEIVRATYQALGSNFSQPSTAFTAPSGTGGLQPETARPRQLVVIGRSQQGRRVMFSIYGTVFNFNSNYRFTRGEGTVVNAVLDGLTNNFGINPLEAPLGIDGTPILWYQYLNINNNSYYETRARR